MQPLNLFFKRFFWMLVLILSALSLSISLLIFLSSWLYRLYLSFVDLGASIGLSTDQLMENYKSIIHYFLSPQNRWLEMPYFNSSAAGLQHFLEVKVLVAVNLLLSLAGLIGIGVFYRKFKRGRKLNYLSVRQAPWIYQLTYFFPVLCLMVIVFAFDRLFIFFHQIFFRNDLWQFNPKVDPVINVLPQSYFMLTFIAVFALYGLIVSLYRLLFK